MEKEPTVLEAPDLVAFALTIGIIFTPFLRSVDRKVCFKTNEDISECIQKFYSNVPVPISDYCKNLKMVRSMIFTLKAGGQR